MTQDEIIRMAREAGLICESRPVTAWIESTDLTPYLTRFAALVAAHEREACAKVADGELMNTNMLTSYPPKSSAAWNIAAAIRARSENGTA